MSKIKKYKASLEVAKVHAQIKDARADFLHKLTTKLVRENDLIAIEDLAVRNMVKNRKLARSTHPSSSPPGRGARGVGGGI